MASIFMKGDKEKLIQASSIAIKSSPISVDNIIKIIECYAILAQVGLDIADHLKILSTKVR